MEPQKNLNSQCTPEGGQGINKAGDITLTLFKPYWKGIVIKIL